MNPYRTGVNLCGEGGIDIFARAILTALSTRRASRRESFAFMTWSKNNGMDKQAILPIDYHSIQLPLNLKQLVLLFDKIVLEEQTLALARTFVTFIAGQGNNDLTNYHFNNQNIDFLANAGIVAFETINKPITVKTGSPEALFMDNTVREWQAVKSSVAALKATVNKGASLFDLMTRIKKLPVSFARSISIRLREEGFDAYPVFDQEPNYSEAGKKEQVFKFALSKIPQPDDGVSWEQIIDFKKDPNTMLKYYALIKWVNEVARENFTLSEIEEEYRYLYHDYAEQYRIHKMKYNQGLIEILISAAIDTLSASLGVGLVRTSLFSIWKNNISLLESEAKLSGREIAYIYKAQQIFKPPV